MEMEICALLNQQCWSRQTLTQSASAREHMWHLDVPASPVSTTLILSGGLGDSFKLIFEACKFVWIQSFECCSRKLETWWQFYLSSGGGSSPTPTSLSYSLARRVGLADPFKCLRLLFRQVLIIYWSSWNLFRQLQFMTMRMITILFIIWTEQNKMLAMSFLTCITLNREG